MLAEERKKKDKLDYQRKESQENAAAEYTKEYNKKQNTKLKTNYNNFPVFSSPGIAFTGRWHIS